MNAKNICLFTGVVARDPEVRYTRNNTAIADFSICVSERYKKNGETVWEKNYFDIEAWGQSAETIGKFFEKGKVIHVVASAKVDKWTDKTTGTNRSKVKFKLESFSFAEKGNEVEGNNSGAEEGEPEVASVGSGESGPGPDNDIPF